VESSRKDIAIDKGEWKLALVSANRRRGGGGGAGQIGGFYSRTNFFGSNLLCINFLTVGFHVFFVLLTEHEVFSIPID